MTAKSWILLVRHGETDWSKTGQHTGSTDIPLTEQGEQGAANLRPVLAGMTFGKVFVSPMIRAQRTAELAGLVGETDANLVEWGYGAYEGRRTEDIRAQLNDPDWTIWRDPIPDGDSPGEQPEQVAERTRRVIANCLPALESGQNCALVAHGHLLRILTATWLGLPATDARLLALDAGALSKLGFEHEQHVIRTWNVAASASVENTEHH
jgi:broad specificity phosphatase PhoE